MRVDRPLSLPGLLSTGSNESHSAPRASVAENRAVRFDFEETFGEDYLYFYASQLSDENERP